MKHTIDIGGGKQCELTAEQLVDYYLKYRKLVQDVAAERKRMEMAVEAAANNGRIEAFQHIILLANKAKVTCLKNTERNSL